ncbi:MAG: lysophospholipid acyltransferase family protein [Terriglobia bacterium]
MRPPGPQTSAEPLAGRNIFYDATLRPLTRRQKLLVRLAAWVGYWLITLVGRTLRWEVVGQENWESIFRAGKRALYTFWHCCIFSATWYWRQRGIVVMSSPNFDGQYTARIIQRHGYGAARGSSSRGGLRALAEMKQHLKQGRDVAFTIDGPRGPRFVAKPGPVLLARRTGNAIFCFHSAPERAYTFRKSWDLFQIPYPFSRVVIFKAPPIYVPADADEAAQEATHREMQATLDRLRAFGESWWQMSAAERERVRTSFSAGVLSALPSPSTGGGPGGA